MTAKVATTTQTTLVRITSGPVGFPIDMMVTSCYQQFIVGSPGPSG